MKYIYSSSEMSVEEKFKSACDQVRKFTKRPPENDMLELYSLYKQATVGNINVVRPNDKEGKAKWEAWNSKKGVPENAAKEMYITKARSLAATYA